MESLMELCDLIAQNPAQFPEKFAWIRSRCPPAESLLGGSPAVSRSQLHAVLAVARFLSKCPNSDQESTKLLTLAFYRSIPLSFDIKFWPQAFPVEAVSSFFHDFLNYISKASELSPDFAVDVAGLTGELVMQTISNAGSGVSRVFLHALCSNFPPILPSDANKLIAVLLDRFDVVVPCSPRELISSTPDTVSAQSSPFSANHFQSPGAEASIVSADSFNSMASKDDASSSRGVVVNGAGSIAWKINGDTFGVGLASNDGEGGGGAGSLGYKKTVALFEEESIESLEKQETVFKLIAHMFSKVAIDQQLMEQVRGIAKDQLHSMLVFLKIRKRDWSEQGQLLKVRINKKLSVYQAAARMQIKTLASLDTEGKSSKRLLHGALALLIEAAEACLFSVWRKVRACEELFGCLLSGISQAAITRGGQLLRVLLIRFKPLVLATCAQAETSSSSPGSMFESVLKTCCEIIEFGWARDRSPVDTFIMGLATSIRERNDYEEEDGKEKPATPHIQLNVIRLLAELNICVKKPEIVDMILPLFIESLEEGDASTPCLLRLRLLDAVSRMASLGFEKSYREAVVLMTRSYLGKLSTVGSAESKTQVPEATTERIETLPAGFVSIASGITCNKLRSDYRHRLLSLCSDVGLAAESKSGRSGADFLGPLLPAVAEICSDFEPGLNVEPSLLKLFRNLWFYIALFGLAPPIQKTQTTTKSVSTALSSVGSMEEFLDPLSVGAPLRMFCGTIQIRKWLCHGAFSVNADQKQNLSRKIGGFTFKYAQYFSFTGPLHQVVSSVKWLEDELELNALHNPGSRRGSGNEKAAVTQRTALSAAVGGRVEVSAMSTISGVKATYLLAVAFLEIIRFSSNGGILNGGPELTASRSAFSCVFEYLRSPNLMSAVSQCLTAIVYRAFETATTWLEDRASDTGPEAEVRESTLSIHACFLIKNLSQRDEHVRDISVSLLTQLRDKFPQILWNSSCLDSLLLSMHNDPPSVVVSDPAYIANVRSLYQKIVREWIVVSLSHAPCTSQGLLQEIWNALVVEFLLFFYTITIGCILFYHENLCKANTWQRTQPTADVVSLLSEIRIGTGKNDCWTGTKTANIPAVMAAAAAASGGNLKLTDAFNLEVLGTGMVSATAKCNHAGEIAGMRRLYESIGGLSQSTDGLNLDFPALGSSPKSQPKNESFNEVLISKFVKLLQKFVITAEKGEEVDKSSFRETCSQATALLLSNLDSEIKSNPESFSQLLRLLCWCPAYISTSDAVETGVYIWAWLVSAAPQLGSLVLAELVDAWLWTIDTKRGLFASDVRCSGPSAKLRPHLAPGEPELHPDKDPVEQIMAHRLWIGFLIDRFEEQRSCSLFLRNRKVVYVHPFDSVSASFQVVRHDSVEQLLLLGRMLQGTTKLPWNFTRHPAATGTFFTLMLFGLKFCSCQTQGNLQNFRLGLQLLEDRIYRSSLGWFAHEPEWFDLNNNNFAQSEAQSVSLFVQHLLNERVETANIDQKAGGAENGGSLPDMKDQYHPVWGQMENYAVGRDKRRQLLLMLCQHEADRLEVWAQPVGSKENATKLKISSDKWIEFARTAFSVDPRIALSLAARFRANASLKSEITQLVQSHILEIRSIAEALAYFVTPKAVDENSILLQQLPHWAACSITQALEFLTPAYKGHPRVMAYVLRVLETYPPERVTFFMPQLVQALRYDEGRLVEGYLLRAAQRSDMFAHILIWHLQGETCVPESEKDAPSATSSSFQELLPVVRQRIIDGFSPKALDIFQREFDFFDKVTSISGVLFPLPKEERRAGIRRELEKIEMDGDDLYLPTAPTKLVRGIQVDSGIPLQSAAKVPIMITFNVVDRYRDPKDIKPQACIFKVGDDCRQDVLALQVISLLKDIFEAVGLNLYLFPYGVLPTGPERGIIENIPLETYLISSAWQVVPNSRSRSQMGETTDGGLYEIFQQDFGPVGSPSFEAARENFLISSAGYAVASLLLQPKDRHNGNLLFDNVGRLVHIDFGFILETSPGNNMRFESAHFKLSHEMTQLLDPSGVMKSDTWYQFVRLCVKGYLAARRYMDGIINTVLIMMDSGLPCFSRGDPIGNLRKRFHPEMSDREAANFMIRICNDAYNKWTTAGYDLIQYLQQGIEK
ncbi:phosphatidylinositol 4-kinase family protein [Striga asiatica]|uniref:1-phosphatidylinositol 4-kinase n=1 Tax=Striga asiatica TaxID=4170 RepID=A0A5A7QAH1_STRAF|nr:phosphatidylinositol 4-kinase family protein [Striga asiatica]